MKLGVVGKGGTGKTTLSTVVVSLLGFGAARAERPS